MKKIVILFLVFSGYLTNGQYTVSSFQDEYVELEDYNSLILETEGYSWYSWEKRFELGFDFPYFEFEYDYIDWTSGSFGEGYAIGLELNEFQYESDVALDSLNIDSDVRYKLLEVDGVKALVIQYTKNRLKTDPSVEEYDSYVNFQDWFYEDGTIEIRYGTSNLDNSPAYESGEGFKLVLPGMSFTAGPWVLLTHPYDTSKVVSYADIDSYEEFVVTDKRLRPLRYWPPEGWVIKFENDLVGNRDIEQEDDIHIYPNPVTDMISIFSDKKIKSISILSLDGNLLKTSINKDQIDIADIKSGMYLVIVMVDDAIRIKKIIKI